MTRKISWPVLAGAVSTLCACQTLPHFTDVATPQGVVPRVSDITDQVQCEILRSIQKSAIDPKGPLGGLQDLEYVANVSLTLEVTDNEGVNPSLSYIDPFRTAGNNFTALLNGQINGTQHRLINVTFTLDFDKNTKDDGKCNPDNQHSGLRGNLGIEEIMATGLRYTTGCRRKENEGCLDPEGSPYKIPAIGALDLRKLVDPLTGAPTLAPSFGSSVDFTLVYGVGGGPNWTLTRFVGLNPPGASLLNFTRTSKDTLILAVAAVSPDTRARDQARAGAGIAAQENVTRMILQRLLP
jgi:hypothetical protein